MYSQSEPCGKPENIPHSKVVGSSFNFNDPLRYECVKGYTLSGPRLRTCGNDGKWSEAPRCEGRSCPFLFKLSENLHKSFVSQKKCCLKLPTCTCFEVRREPGIEGEQGFDRSRVDQLQKVVTTFLNL